MEMTKSQVARVAANLLETLRKNDLTTPQAVQGAAGKVFGDQVDDDHSGEEYVEISAHPRDPSALIVGYLRRIGQQPMQLMLRQARCKVVLTCVDELEGYACFDEEPSFGKMQDRAFADFAQVQAELERLSKLA
jgi:hypothetical protein